MRTLEKLRQNGFSELMKTSQISCWGGTSGTRSYSSCDNQTGIATTTTITRTDNADGTYCETTTRTHEQ